MTAAKEKHDEIVGAELSDLTREEAETLNAEIVEHVGEMNDVYESEPAALSDAVEIAPVEAELLLTVEAARKVTDDIREAGERLVELVTVAYRGQAWRALGYDDWDSWCGTEFAANEVTRAMVWSRALELNKAGLSTRAIAEVADKSQSAASRKVRQVSGFDSPAHKVVGKDGKQYPARKRETLEPPTSPPSSDINDEDADYRCPSCGVTYTEDEATEENWYECGECGEVYSRSNSADGDSNRCPSCNRFGARAEPRCPDCEEELEKLVDATAPVDLGALHDKAAENQLVSCLKDIADTLVVARDLADAKRLETTSLDTLKEEHAKLGKVQDEVAELVARFDIELEARNAGAAHEAPRRDEVVRHEAGNLAAGEARRRQPKVKPVRGKRGPECENQLELPEQTQ